MSIKQFSLLNKLGQGAYAEVYKVRKISSGAQYALKKVKLSNLSEKELQNALNQVRILASIKSPNIIAYKESFLQGKNLCIVMEFADGGDLYQKITEHKKTNMYFPQSEIWKVLINITQALHLLHTAKIYHRDLKAANIFLTKDGFAKLGDMNVSKIAKNGLLYTQTGTPYYASPQVWNDMPYDSKSDIWSFGVVMYEMACLHVPFQAADMESLGKVVTTGNYEPLPAEYSLQLSSLIKMMLNLKAKNRPSAGRLLNSNLLTKKALQLGLIVNQEQGCQQLLKTIKVPKNLYYITSRLPDSNYEDNSSIKSVKTRQKTLPKLQKQIKKLPTQDMIDLYDKHRVVVNKNNVLVEQRQGKSVDKEYEDVIKKGYYDRRRIYEGRSHLPPIKI